VELEDVGMRTQTLHGLDLLEPVSLIHTDVIITIVIIISTLYDHVGKEFTCHYSSVKHIIIMTNIHSLSLSHTHTLFLSHTHTHRVWVNHVTRHPQVAAVAP